MWVLLELYYTPKRYHLKWSMFDYVLIHYVQTNVNYLPLKYPQNQVQRSIGGSHADPKE